MTSALEEAILTSNQFTTTLQRVAKMSVLRDLPAIEPADESRDIDWNFALLAASGLTSARSEVAIDAALLVAQGCLAANDSEEHQREAAAVLLERLGNFPAASLAVRRNLVEEAAWADAPIPLRLDVVRRRLELSIPLANGETLVANQFQRNFWNAAMESQWVSVSAPTSAGKSYVVKRWFEERLAVSEKFRGVYLVPTRALIAEVSDDLRRFFGTAAGIHSLPWDSEIGSKPKELFVVTQERLHLLQQRTSDFALDVVFVDEAQKFGDGPRGVLLQRVLDETVRSNPAAQVLLASPLSSNPELLLEGAPAAANPMELRSEEVTVNQNLLWATQVKYQPKEWELDLLISGERQLVGKVSLPSSPTQVTKRLPFLAVALGRNEGDDTGGNVVYVNGPAAAEQAAHQIYDALGDEAEISEDSRVSALVELVQKTIHRDYLLATVIKRGVAFHYGNIPLLVRGEIESLFRDGILKYLVCTSTLLEGVNLPCRNLFARGPKKGRNRFMTPADFWNLAGRAGRWGKEFQGNIICVDPTIESLWPDPPRTRALQPLKRASDEVLTDLERLEGYIEGGALIEESRKDPVLESVYSFLATRVAERIPLQSVQGLQLSEGEADHLEATIASSLAQVEISASLLAAHPGVSPLSLQRLLEYFRDKSDPESLVIAPPESADALDTYVKALGRIDRLLGGTFGGPGRRYVLALLITHWMRGHPLSRLIAERIAYFERKNRDFKVRTVIRNTMNDVEQYARFEAPKYMAAYLDILRYFLVESGRRDLVEMPDIAMMLELGVSSTTSLSLMTMGLSRTSAIEISELIADDELSPTQARAWIAEGGLEQSELPALVLAEVRGFLETT